MMCISGFNCCASLSQCYCFSKEIFPYFLSHISRQIKSVCGIYFGLYCWILLKFPNYFLLSAFTAQLTSSMISIQYCCKFPFVKFTAICHSTCTYIFFLNICNVLRESQPLCKSFENVHCSIRWLLSLKSTVWHWRLTLRPQINTGPHKVKDHGRYVWILVCI